MYPSNSSSCSSFFGLSSQFLEPGRRHRHYHCHLRFHGSFPSDITANSHSTFTNNFIFRTLQTNIVQWNINTFDFTDFVKQNRETNRRMFTARLLSFLSLWFSFSSYLFVLLKLLLELLHQDAIPWAPLYNEEVSRTDETLAFAHHWPNTVLHSRGLHQISTSP